MGATAQMAGESFFPPRGAAGRSVKSDNSHKNKTDQTEITTMIWTWTIEEQKMVTRRLIKCKCIWVNLCIEEASYSSNMDKKTKEKPHGSDTVDVTKEHEKFRVKLRDSGAFINSITSIDIDLIIDLVLMEASRGCLFNENLYDEYYTPPPQTWRL